MGRLTTTWPRGARRAICDTSNFAGPACLSSRLPDPLPLRCGNFGPERICPAALELQRNFVCVMSSAVGSQSPPPQVCSKIYHRPPSPITPGITETHEGCFGRHLFEMNFGSRGWSPTSGLSHLRGEVKDSMHDLAGRSQHASQLSCLLLTCYRPESPERNGLVSSTPIRHHRPYRLPTRVEEVTKRLPVHATKAQSSKYTFDAM